MATRGKARVLELLGAPRKTSLVHDVWTITPAVAEELLHLNENFRQPKNRTIENYERDMLLGQWSLTGEPLIFDKNGKLKNGQNRLHACVNTSKSFTTVIVIGVEPETDLDMDSGAKRLFSDWLAYEGYSETSTLAATIRLSYQIVELKEVTQSPTGLTNEELRGWFKRGHEGIVDDLERVAPMAGFLPKAFTKTIAASVRHAAHFIPGVHSVDVDAYLAKLVMSEDTIDKRSVEYQVAQAFHQERSRSRSGRVQQPVAAAMAINGLNAYLLGGDVTASQIYWERGGRNPDPFPQITPSPKAVAELEEEPAGGRGSSR